MTEVTIPDGIAVIEKRTSLASYEVHYYFRLVANNGEPIAQSEQYTQKHNVMEVLAKYFPNFMLDDQTGE